MPEVPGGGPGSNSAMLAYKGLAFHMEPAFHFSSSLTLTVCSPYAPFPCKPSLGLPREGEGGWMCPRETLSVKL